MYYEFNIILKVCYKDPWASFKKYSTSKSISNLSAQPMTSVAFITLYKTTANRSVHDSWCVKTGTLKYLILCIEKQGMRFALLKDLRNFKQRIHLYETKHYWNEINIIWVFIEMSYRKITVMVNCLWKFFDNLEYIWITVYKI